MRKLVYLMGLICGWNAFCQVPPEKIPEFNLDDFVVFTLHTDTINQIDYQLGRFEPDDYRFEMNRLGEWEKIKITPDTNHNFQHIAAPNYLKISSKNEINYYFLSSYYDTDMFSFPDLPSENFQLIKGRYAFHLYHKKEEILSSRQIPGVGQYQGEDAVSGLYSALTFFDNEKFILGNVQAFGIFCFNLRDYSQPIELKQYQIYEENNGQYYAFFSPVDNGNFDIIVAQADLSSSSPNINRLYHKLKNIRYAATNIQLKTDLKGEPIVKVEENHLIVFTDNSVLQLNLITGKLSEN